MQLKNIGKLFYRKFFSLDLPDLPHDFRLFIFSQTTAKGMCPSQDVTWGYTYVRLPLISDFNFGQGVDWFIHCIVTVFPLTVSKQPAGRS